VKEKRTNRRKSIAELIRDLCPKKGSSVTSITISSGEKSVTLTAEDRERIDKRIKEGKVKR
jgi:hypothetical protein